MHFVLTGKTRVEVKVNFATLPKLTFFQRNNEAVAVYLLPTLILPHFSMHSKAKNLC